VGRYAGGAQLLRPQDRRIHFLTAARPDQQPIPIVISIHEDAPAISGLALMTTGCFALTGVRKISDIPSQSG